MRHIQISAKDDRLFGVKLLQVAAQVILPLHTVVDARQLVLGVGYIEVDEVEIRVFQRDGAALMVMDILVQAVPHAERRCFGPDRRARVALFIGAVDVLGIASGAKSACPGCIFVS